MKATGTQAKTNLTVLAGGTVITKEQAGTVTINGLEVRVEEGDTGNDVNEKIRNAAAKIGMDYNITTGELVSQQSGKSQSITVKATSDDLRALLGTNQPTVYGTDAKAEFMTDNGKRIGFADTATIDTDGNRITVTDKNGFKMVYDAQLDSPTGGIGDATVTVLSAGPMVIQIGNNEGQTLNVNISKTTAESLEINHINVYTNAYASEAIERVDDAVAKISGIRSALGAYQNRLDHTVNNLETADENLTSAVSRIRDTDMAEEITEYTQQNVLSQSALQMLIKSNARPEGLLQLFQR